MIPYLSYLKIPYKHMGYDYSGADCYGLLYLFYRDELGITLPLPDFEYAKDWWKSDNHIIGLHKEYSFRLCSEPPAKGDVILFKNTSSTAGHIGIALDDSSFMHMAQSGCAVTTYTYGVWHRQIHSVYRHINRDGQ